MSSYPVLIDYPDLREVRVRTVMGHDDSLDDDLVSLLEDARLTYESRHVLGYHVTDPSVDYYGLVRDTITILGAAGGLGGVAAILKAFFDRHKGISVKFGENREIQQTDGLSVDEIIRLLAVSERGPLWGVEASANFEELEDNEMHRSDELSRNMGKLDGTSEDKGEVG